MKKLFLSIIILILTISESFAQWKPFPFEDATFLGVTDSTLFANAAQSHLYRYDPALAGPPVYGWIELDTGLGTGPDKAVTACGSIGPYLCVGTNIGGFYRSIDIGKHWTITGYGLPGASYSGFITIDSMLIAATGGIFRSIDSGVHWTESDSGLTNKGGINAIAMSGTNLFAAANGGIFRSTDNGNNWVLVNSQAVGAGAVVVAGTNIFCIGGPGIFRSTDGGGHWTEADSGLEPNPISTLVSYGKSLFAATNTGNDIGNRGIYCSTDSGVHWDTVNAGLPYLEVLGLVVYDTDLIANIAFNGSSNLYIRPISEMVKKDTTSGIVEQPSPADSISIYPNPSTGMVTIFGSFPIHGVSIENILGSDVLDVPNGSGSQVTFDLSKFPSGTYFIRIRTEDGNMLRKIVKE